MGTFCLEEAASTKDDADNDQDHHDHQKPVQHGVLLSFNVDGTLPDPGLGT